MEAYLKDLAKIILGNMKLSVMESCSRIQKRMPQENYQLRGFLL